MKKCYFCKGEVVRKKITHMHHWGNKVVMFEQTPAEVCKQCGEVYIKPEVAKVFDKAVTHLKKIKKTIQIPVARYSELAKNS